MISSVSNFYNTLFTIEITIFGIIFAAILVFIQLFISRFPDMDLNVKKVWNEIKKREDSKFIISFFSIFIFDLCITIFGSLSVFINNHFYLKITSSIYYSSFSLLLLIIFIIVFIYINFRLLRYLKSERFLIYLDGTIEFDEIRNYLFKIYDFKNLNEYKPLLDLSLYDQAFKISKKEEKDILEKNKKKEIYKLEAKKEKERVKDSVDPFLSLRNLILNNIKNYNIHEVEESLKIFNKKIKEFLGSIPKISNNLGNNLNAGLDTNMIDYYLKFIKTLMNLSIKENSEEIIQIIISSVDEIIDFLLKHSNNNIFAIIDDFKDLSSDNIIKFPIILKNTIRIYEKIYNNFIKIKELQEYYSSIEYLMNDFIYLGEDLLINFKFKEEYITNNHSLENLHDYYFNTLLNFNESKLFGYTDYHMYGIKVLIEKLNNIYIKTKNERVGDLIGHLIREIFSIGEYAIKNDNINDINFAIEKIEDLFKYFNTYANSEKGFHLEILKELINMAYNMAARNIFNQKDNILNFLSEIKKVDEIKEYLLRPEILRTYESNKNYNKDLADEFIKRLKDRLYIE